MVEVEFSTSNYAHMSVHAIGVGALSEAQLGAAIANAMSDNQANMTMGQARRLIELVASYIDGAPQYWNDLDADVFIELARREVMCNEVVGMDVVKSRGQPDPVKRRSAME